MKKLLVASLVVSSFGALAQEQGRVISSTPVVQQVAVQRQVCSQQAVPVERQTSGMGGLFGSIAGAAIGSQIGSGDGRIAATLIGAVGGALLGNHAEGGGSYAAQPSQVCAPQTSYENRTVGYNVTYEYNGRQHTVQMPHDPGTTVQLQVAPVGAIAAPVAGARPAMPAQPLVTAPRMTQSGEAPVIAVAPAPAQVIITEPLHTVVYPSYAYVPRVVYPNYWYPPISLNFGYLHRHRHHRGYWR